TRLGWLVWLPGEPNDFHGAEDCALAKKGGWNDDTCAKFFSWICEKKPVSAPCQWTGTILRSS
uniref:C-type lectin domain-containing protein n=1 Tax=Gadus morhua TaxID=8049 RepID=A0A8C5CAW4_GADMO